MVFKEGLNAFDGFFIKKNYASRIRDKIVLKLAIKFWGGGRRKKSSSALLFQLNGAHVARIRIIFMCTHIYIHK